MDQARLGSLTAMASVALVGTTAVAAAAPEAYDRPGKTERVSVASNGAQANAGPSTNGDDVGYGVISADGRYVAFTSTASNLVPGDTNQQIDVFRRDRKTGRTVRVSVASDGTQAISLPGFGEWVGSISADGRYVAFGSSTNLKYDTFVHDVQTRRTVRVSVASDGTQANANSGRGASLSADGRYVAFVSGANNLVPDDINSNTDVFVHDLRTHKTVLASRSSAGVQADDWSYGPSLSADGRYLAFSSLATNLVPDQPLERALSVFWRDLKTGETRRASVASDGAPASFSAFPACAVGGLEIPLPSPSPGSLVVPGLRLCFSGTTGHGAISADGRYVTFASNATNLVPNDTNFSGLADGYDVFVHDVRTGRTADVGGLLRPSARRCRDEPVCSARMVATSSTRRPAGNPRCRA